MYTYVKGQGWVTGNLVTMKCGKVVRLEMRDPVDGECFGFTDEYDDLEKWSKLDPWFDFISTMRYAVWTASQINYIKRHSPDTIFVVCVPVDTYPSTEVRS